MLARLSRSFSTPISPTPLPLTVLFAGSSSDLGSSLIKALERKAEATSQLIHLLTLSRTVQPTHVTSSSHFTVSPLTWDGNTPPPLSSHPSLPSLTHVINLCGSNISASSIGPVRPWEQTGKIKELFDSRISSTRGLVEWLESNAGDLTEKKVQMINAGGVGIYGMDHTRDSHPSPPEDESLPLASDSRGGLLAEISRSWEAAATTSNPSKFPISVLRIAPVLLKAPSVFTAPGVLKSLIPPFYFGVGGPVGSGNQLFPFICERDFQRVVIDHIMSRGESGVYNLISPHVISNTEFSLALATALNRPCVIPLPGFVVKAAFGQMGEEVMMGGVTCRPGRLEREGFLFRDGRVEEAMEWAVGDLKYSN